MSDVQEPAEERSEALFKAAGQPEGPEPVGESGLEAYGDMPEGPPRPPESPSRPPRPLAGASPTPAQEPRRRSFSLFWPLVLIGAGVVLLLSNLGYLPQASWNLLWRLWPLLLIALGIDALIGRRSLAGAIVGGLLIAALIAAVIALIFFAQHIPALVEWTQPVGWQIEHVEYPLAGVERAAIDIDWTSLPGYLSALRDSPNLIAGDLAYRGRLIFEVEKRGTRAEVRLDRDASGVWFGPADLDERQKRWEVKLSPRVPLELTLDAGSGPCQFDLRDLQISELKLDVGSGSVELYLPSSGSFEVRIEGGSGPLDIVMPEKVGARVELESGSGTFRPAERFRLAEGERDDDGVWETANIEGADQVIELVIDQGSGPIHIR